MYGSRMGTLNVYTRIGNNRGTPVWTRKSNQGECNFDTGSFCSWTNTQAGDNFDWALQQGVWTKNGTQGNRWINATVDINLGNSNQKQYQVVFEGIRGSGIRGDIAIDDISLRDGLCSSGGGSNPGTCDFEDPQLCGYTQDTSDKFDWTRQARGTQSSRTGPSSDHTYGTAQGHYMYIETSAPRVRGDNAWLVSPQHAASNDDVCVTFYYHMYGASIGTLNVRLRANTNTGNPEWSMSGLCSWTNSQKDDFDWMLHKAQGQFSCNFDTNLCAWTQDKTDVFDWQRTKGSTPTVGTGPTSDHTSTLTGIAGYYMFIETSSPRHPGDKARLISPQVSGTAHCVKFWYLMWGDHVATLNVYSRTGPSLGNPVFTRSGTQGRNWLSASVDISSNVPFQVCR
nr:hypothetical protein BaRGS_022054 [Batillaria attramentaria]